jgi:hypothetical protein
MPQHLKEVGDYVLRKYRGQVGKFLKRRSVLRSHQVCVVVYTLNAYMKDPDFTRDELYLKKEKYTHVLVAVLGSFMPLKTTVSYSRFVKNLAGANNEYKVMNKEQLVKLAKAVINYNDGYSTVAD